MGRKRANPDLCPICGEYMDILCTGHSQIPFIDGKKYASICFVCFHVPKIWTFTPGRARNGSQDEWDGPFWDPKLLHTAAELVDMGVCDLNRARKSIRATKQKLK